MLLGTEEPNRTCVPNSSALPPMLAEGADRTLAAPDQAEEGRAAELPMLLAAYDSMQSALPHIVAAARLVTGAGRTPAEGCC